jgi:hypothetical protein
LLNLEEVQWNEVPELHWTLGERSLDVRRWKALHDAFRFTLSYARGNLDSVDWGRVV